MKTLPNGLTIFNATPHVIRFWRESWPEPIEVEPDEVISATITEKVVDRLEIPPAIDNLNPRDTEQGTKIIDLVTTEFVGDESVFHLIEEAYEMGADVVVGSLIAAQTYRGVVAMTPAPGYERRPPAEKRMNPDKFTVFRDKALTRKQKDRLYRLAWQGSTGQGDVDWLDRVIGPSR